MVARFKAFSLSHREMAAVQLGVEDVIVGMDEVGRSLIGKVFGDKRSNFVGMRNVMMKLWQHKELHKVVALEQNVYQFIFKSAVEREEILQGRPWLFYNQIVVLQPWGENLHWKMDCFNASPIWVRYGMFPLIGFRLRLVRK